MAKAEEVMSYLSACGDHVNSERENALKLRENNNQHSITSLIQGQNIADSGLNLLRKKKKDEELQRRRKKRTLSELFGSGKSKIPQIEGTCSNIEEEVQSALLSFQEDNRTDLAQKESEDETGSDISVLTMTCDEDSDLSLLIKGPGTHLENVEELETQSDNGEEEDFELLKTQGESHPLPPDNHNFQMRIENVISFTNDGEDDLRIIHSDETDT